MDVPALHQPFVVGEEEGEQQVADVEAVHVGIGGEDDPIVAQAVYRVLNAERLHDVVEFLILVQHVHALPPGVERLALETEDRLCVDVTAADHAPSCRNPLGEEDHALLPALGLVAEVDLAILEVGNRERGFAGVLTGCFLDLAQLLADALVRLHLLAQCLGGVRVFVEKVHQRVPHERHQPRAQVGVAQLVLGLRFKDRLLDLHRDCTHQPVAHVRPLEAGLEELVDALEHAFPERAQVAAPVVGVVAVDVAEMLLAVAVGVREGEFDVLGTGVDGIVKVVLLNFLLEQVEQPVLGLEALAVEREREVAVEVGVVPEPAAHRCEVVGVFRKQLGVRHKAHKRPRFLRRGLRLARVDQLALSEQRPHGLALAEGGDLELFGKRVDGLRAHPVEADAELEDLVVVLRPGVDHRNAVHQLALRDAASVVPHGDLAAVNADFDAASVPHDELINRVVNDFLEEDVDAVVGMRAVAEPPDVHARTEADVFE